MATVLVLGFVLADYRRQLNKEKLYALTNLVQPVYYGDLK